jgi:hypothetical protein
MQNDFCVTPLFVSRRERVTRTLKINPTAQVRYRNEDGSKLQKNVPNMKLSQLLYSFL